ncbi:MAG: hypothetical protein ACXW2F_01560 [Thermoanaerobaculia bacterium]
MRIVEFTAIAWTWAASRHLDIEPADTFHEEVISGNGPTLLENFSTGRFVGVPMLQYWGLAVSRRRTPLHKASMPIHTCFDGCEREK